ncbi:EAL domain-containing protein [Idiomarina sp. X4]|uniref:EAL domain-containing protein n=1 Tax=Idiomarina sp. X4 TaxID=2055892 RepID=UPI0018E28C53|nr:EAL domain-containing protein [Idiomarina sp. X4]
MQTESVFIVSFVLLVLSATIVRLVISSGGLPSIYSSLIYIPLAIVGLLFGFRVGLLFGAIVAIVMGPFALSSPFISDNLVSTGWVFLLMSCTFVPVITGLVSSTLKTTLRREQHAKFRHQETGLPNIKALLGYFKSLSKNPRLSDESLFDIIDIRLKNFDDIQQKIGTEKAHRLVKLMAKQLSELLGNQVHFGQASDNELIGVQHAAEKENHNVQDNLKEYLQKEVQAEDGTSYQLAPSASILRVNKRQLTESSQEVLKRSRDRAYRVKDTGDILSFFDESEPAQQQSSFSKQFKDALINNEISLLYQPRLSTVTGHFETLEVSSRWLHPTRGDIIFSEFASMIKENQLTKDYLMWMIESCFADLSQFAQQQRQPKVSIDISLGEDVEPNVLYALANKIQTTDYPPTRICVEVLDSALMNLPPKTRTYLEKLHNIGCNIIADHFGEGFSTIQSLFKLPVDAIKLSDELIHSAGSNSDAKRQLASIVKIAHAKGLRTIATGVNSKQQLLLLKHIGCEELQGSVLTPPVPKKALPWERIK